MVPEQWVEAERTQEKRDMQHAPALGHATLPPFVLMYERMSARSYTNPFLSLRGWLALIVQLLGQSTHVLDRVHDFQEWLETQRAAIVGRELSLRALHEHVGVLLSRHGLPCVVYVLHKTVPSLAGR